MAVSVAFVVSALLLGSVLCHGEFFLLQFNSCIGLLTPIRTFAACGPGERARSYPHGPLDHEHSCRYAPLISCHGHPLIQSAGVSPELIAEQHGHRFLGKVRGFKDVYLFEKHPDTVHGVTHPHHHENPSIEWADQQGGLFPIYF